DLKAATCRLDLTGLDAGVHTLPVHLSDIGLPKGIDPKTLLTESVTVRLAPMTSKSAGVVAVLEGSPAPGYAVAGVKLTPDRIVLKGTEAMLSPIDAVKTRPINLEAAAESFKKQVPLNLPEAIAVDPPLRIVLAEVTIKERMVTRVMENIPVSGKGSADTFRIDPPTISLTVSGPEAVVNAVASDPDFAVTVDMTGLPPGVYNLKATINLPVQIKLIRVSPERFTTTIEK
ncbi:MAG TPA: CdaR family protein, partial [Desulfosarcina sp.]|nr:CdaR family protein [Desulfosarcina sp.]